MRPVCSKYVLASYLNFNFHVKYDLVTLNSLVCTINYRLYIDINVYLFKILTLIEKCVDYNQKLWKILLLAFG